MSTATEKKKSKKTNIIINVLGVLFIAAGMVWSIGKFARFNKNEVTNDAQIEEYISPVNTRIGGYIKEIRFTEHQPVKKGDTLVIIDDRELIIQLAQAEATLLDAQANKTVASSSINTVSNNTAVAEAGLDEVRVRLENARQNYVRYTNLLHDESVSRQQFEQVQTEYKALKAKYQTLQRQKQSARLQTSEVSQRLNVVAANIMRAQAAVDMAKLNLSYTVITAPYNGFTGRRNLQEGQLVQPGQALVALVKDDQKWVVANYKETQTANLHTGQEVTIKVDALKDKEFHGKITAISQATGAKYSLVPTDNSAGNFVKIQQRIPVRIDFVGNTATDQELLRAGMNVEVEAKLQ